MQKYQNNYFFALNFLKTYNTSSKTIQKTFFESKNVT
jgi:hypothetical protein